MRVANDSQRQQQKEEELAERKQVEKAERLLRAEGMWCIRGTEV